MAFSDEKERYTIWITKKQKEALKQLADEQEMSMSQYMRIMIKRILSDTNLGNSE